MQSQAIDKNDEVDEVDEDTIDELEDMDDIDGYDSAQRLLRMQNQVIDGNNEVHEEIFDELEDKFLNMVDYSAQALRFKTVNQKLEFRTQKLESIGS